MLKYLMMEIMVTTMGLGYAVFDRKKVYVAFLKRRRRDELNIWERTCTIS